MRTHAAALVGRELEKQLLVGTFERAELIGNAISGFST